MKNDTLEQLRARVGTAIEAYQRSQGTRREGWCRRHFINAGRAYDVARRAAAKVDVSVAAGEVSEPASETRGMRCD